jgi:hypothetical protein
VYIAQATAPATGHDQLFVMFDNVTQQGTGFLVVNLGAAGDGNNTVFSVAPVLSLATTGAAVVSSLVGNVVYVNEGIVVAVSPEDYIAAVTTVAAIRTAVGDELLPAEANAAIAPIAGTGMNNDRVYESACRHEFIVDWMPVCKDLPTQPPLPER